MLQAWVGAEELQTICTSRSSVFECGSPASRSHEQAFRPPSPALWWHCASINPSRPNSDSPRSNHAAKRLVATAVGRRDADAQDRGDEKSIDCLETPAGNIFSALGTDKASVPLEEIHNSVIEKYLETLYLSKASLAYFAKGPLSRARANVGESNDAVHGLVDLLRQTVLSAATIDKKYKRRLPDSVKSLTEQDLDSLTAKGESRQSRGLSKARNRLRPSKEGLFPREMNFVTKWWFADDCNRFATSEQSYLARRLADLRLRECLLQLILVLEVMSLEKLLHKSNPDSQQGYSQKTGGNRARKIKKPADLSLSLDILVDRLCIWQSINHEELDRQPGAHSLDANDAIPKSSGTNDQLKDFCLEVVLPFYSSRLASKVKDIASKFGVPVQSSPSLKRKALLMTEFNDRKQRKRPAPGTEVQRKAHAVPQKPHLSRDKYDEALRCNPGHGSVRSKEKTADDSRPSRRVPPVLSRSSTDTALLEEHKRPRSSTPSISNQSMNVAGMHSRNRSLSRSNSALGSAVISSKRLASREVDMSAIHRFNEARSLAKKKGLKESHATDSISKGGRGVEAELASAISTLKKPNRGAAVKEYVDGAEERRHGLARGNKAKCNISRGFKRPDITSGGTGIQVGATPRKDREIDASRRIHTHSTSKFVAPPPPSVLKNTPLKPGHSGWFPPSHSQALDAFDSDDPDKNLVPSSAVRPVTNTSASHIVSNARNTPCAATYSASSATAQANLVPYFSATNTTSAPQGISDSPVMDRVMMRPRNSHHLDTPSRRRTRKIAPQPVTATPPRKAWGAVTATGDMVMESSPARPGAQEARIHGYEAKEWLDSSPPGSVSTHRTGSGSNSAALKETGPSVYELLGWDDVDELA